MQQRYQAVVGSLPRSAPRQHVESICEELEELWRDIREVLESFVDSRNTDSNESHFGCHIQNSNPESNSESENGSGERPEADGRAEYPENLGSQPKRELPLGVVLSACPNMRELAQNGALVHWRDFVAAAELARPMLGISPSAWREACGVLGERQAAITLAAIYQRADQINSAGGYLRSLTDRARDGKFSTWPMVMALLRARLDAETTPSETPGEPPGDGNRKEGIAVSETLLRSLRRLKS